MEEDKMKDYTKLLPKHEERLIGVNDLYLETFEATTGERKADEAATEEAATEEATAGERTAGERTSGRPPVLFVHGAYTGSWMWSKYIPHFIGNGWKCYVMNLRSHYKSRSMDMTRITFEDYLEDIRENIRIATAECSIPPVVIGFSLGGILCQKIAETEKIKGLVLADSSVCREVQEAVPYEAYQPNNLGSVVPAPVREERYSVDESEEDILFQRRYLSMEASGALLACGCWIEGIKGISIDAEKITCPVLSLKACGNDTDDRRGKAEAAYYHGEYEGYRDMTHTGMLIGQRYHEPVRRILAWLSAKFSRDYQPD